VPVRLSQIEHYPGVAGLTPQFFREQADVPLELVGLEAAVVPVIDGQGRQGVLARPGGRREVLMRCADEAGVEASAREPDIGIHESSVALYQPVHVGRELRTP